MFSYTDQLKRKIVLSGHPKRIISLVPSQTELLFDLGLEEEVIGITKFCVHPTQWFRNKPRIGGTKKVNIDLVRSLQPDLIIANKEENEKSQVTELETIAPVWISDITNTETALQMIKAIGQITGRDEKASTIITQIKKDLAAVTLRTQQTYRTAYLIWKDPYMTVGGDTFINDILSKPGFKNIFSHRSRYPEIAITDLKENNPELVLLSTEPYPFRQKHIDELSIALPGTKIMLVDGEIFSWYGSRMLHISSYMHGLMTEINVV